MTEMPLDIVLSRGVALACLLALEHSPSARAGAARSLAGLFPPSWLLWFVALVSASWRPLHLLMLLVVLVSTFHDATQFLFSPITAVAMVESVVLLFIFWGRIKNGPGLDV